MLGRGNGVRIGLTLVSLSLATCVALAQTGRIPARSAATDSAALVALEARTENAVVRRDVEFLRGICGRDFQFGHATGEREDRDAWLASVRGSRFTLRSVDSLDVEVNGDVALVTGRLHVRAEDAEPQWREYTVRYARVYARRAGRWRLLTHRSPDLALGPPS